MKKVNLAVAAVLALSALSTASCSKDQAPAAATMAAGDSTTVNTRYINMVRIYTNYTLAQETLAEQQRLLLDYQNQAQAKQYELQRMYQTMQQKAQNNVYLTPQSAQADEQAFMKRQTEAQQWSEQREQQMGMYMAQQTARVEDSIRNVIRDLSVAYNFDAVLNDTIAYYVNPALDITETVIAELNRRYKSAAPADTATVKK